jgi:[ribosomal protein S5]-alanine N-acetyltransferase
MPEPLLAACAQSADLYKRVGYQAPWVSYVAVDCGAGVGGGAFVGPPSGNVVEIAYFTLEEFWGRGYATRTAQRLLEIAKSATPSVSIKALTLPQRSPSTKILERLGFKVVGFAHDDDAGEVWEWRAY